MTKREVYQKLHDAKLEELVQTRDKAEKLEHQVNLLRNWIEIEELEQEAKNLSP